MDGMHIFVPGDGLCSTHVTWDDIEKDMQLSLNTSARFGPDKNVKDIGDGKGFMSKILLVDPDWQPQQEELPKNFVVKILTQLAMQKLSSSVSRDKGSFTDLDFMITYEALQKRCHNAEIAAYKQLAKIPSGLLEIPKIYSMKKFTESNVAKGYIIMEFYKDMNGAELHRNVTPDSLKPVLRYLAIMTANSLDATEEEKEDFHRTPFIDIWGSEFIVQMTNQMLSALGSWENGRFMERVDRMQSISDELYDFHRVDKLAEECGMKRVLCHGDLWTGNMLWTSKGDDLQFFTVLDFQASHYGCTATDFVRLFAVGLSGADRRKHWEELVEVFYQYLQEHIGTRQMPYTLEQLKEAYRRFFPIGAAMIVPYIAPMFSAVVKDATEVERQKVIEKTECLLDDMFEGYERNVKLKGETV